VSEISDELWRRARHLVEVAGRSYTAGNTVRYHYGDAVINIHWNHSTLDTLVQRGSLHVSCEATGTALVTVSGQSICCHVEDYEAEKFVEYLRKLMVLDDLVRGVASG